MTGRIVGIAEVAINAAIVTAIIRHKVTKKAIFAREE